MAEIACPLCGDTRMSSSRPLYGRQVCRFCWSVFINRRQIAWALDVVALWFLASFLVTLWPPVARWHFYAILALLFTAKDSFRGQSLGRAICGLQVVDRDSGAPAGPLRCAARNWFLPVPYLGVPCLVLWVWANTTRGPRLGDGITRTRVIRKRYRDHPVFSPPAAVAKVFE